MVTCAGPSARVFHPGTAEATLGQTITFTNKESATHKIVWDEIPDGAVDSDSTNLGRNATFEYTPAAAGTYNFHCPYHSGMTGTLIITD